MRKINRITKNVEKLFPDHQINLKRRFETVYSEIFIMELIKSGTDTPQKVLVKFCGSNNSVEVLNEFRNLSIFNKECKDERILTPKPSRVDPKNGMIVMEYIEGTSLKQLLLKLRHVNKKKITELIDLSAIALSKFHYIFRRTKHEQLLIDSPWLGEDVDTNINNNILLSQCNLQIRAKAFIDFSVWNIMINDGIPPKIYLIDFPEKECICTPHLDLARFKYSLEIIKQYPQFRFLRMNWWDIDSIYGNFLERYCEEMKVDLNKQDIAIITYFIKEHVIMMKNIYANSKSNMRFKLERLYLRRFIETYLNLNERRK